MNGILYPAKRGFLKKEKPAWEKKIDAPHCF